MRFPYKEEQVEGRDDGYQIAWDTDSESATEEKKPETCDACKASVDKTYPAHPIFGEIKRICIDCCI